ncbi:lipopolysaccharide biosynthesis protein [Cohnella sp. REN36]|uniref:lipopolysaccharide biosynthesis protein n=1 Tax=Cohnella sp. REN36 TaxID=2887347 RepID=UPI001D15B94D|nr:oligosaccharide flippase family protein [Cohnella sp. REN36]MCC3375996.1 oligosaccharide flippase family protein [Cohnella sp. REN36]
MIAKLKKRLSLVKKNRDLNNVGYSLLSYLITPFVLFFSTPILLKHLGAENYGFWVLINSIIVVMTVSNFGLGNAMIKLGAEFYSDTRESQVAFNRLFKVTLTITFWISIVVLGLSVGLGPLFLGLFLDESKESHLFSMSIVIGAIVAFRILNSVIAGSYMAKQRYDLNSKVNIIVNLLSSIVFTIIAVTFSDLSYMMYALLLSSVILMLINGLLAKKISSYLEYKMLFDKEIVKRVVHYGVYSGSQTIISTLYTQADKFVVGGLLGPSVLGYYTICMQIVSKIHEIPAAAGSYLFAKFSMLNETKNYTAIRKVYYRSLLICCAFIVIASTVTIVFAKEILTLWISPVFAAQHYEFMQYLIVGVLLGAFGVIPYYYLNGTGFVRANTVINFLISFCTLGTMAIAIPLIGLTGVAIGKMAGFPMVLFSCYFIERHMRCEKSLLSSQDLHPRTLPNRG